MDDLDNFNNCELQMDSEEFSTLLEGNFPNFPAIDSFGSHVKAEPPYEIYQQQLQHGAQLQQQPQLLQQQPHQQQANDQLLEQQLAQIPIDIIPMAMATPSHFGKHPNLAEVISKYDFTVGVPPEQHNNVVYSHQKLFIKIDSKMTFSITYAEQSKGEQLYLRVMIVYSSTENMHLAVNRCANHQYRPSADEEHKDDKDARFANIIKVNHPSAMYWGKKTGETFGERLSVVVPLDGDRFDADGNLTQLICMEFGCQNSCTSGINRRPTTLVFTLESQSYQLLGRGTIEFKVCSCPKRDANREKEPKHKRDAEKACPRGKRPKYPEPARLVKPEPESESDSNNDGTSQDTKISMTSLTIPVPTELIPEILRDIQAKVALKIVRESRNQYTQLDACLKELRKMEKSTERK